MDILAGLSFFVLTIIASYYKDYIRYPENGNEAMKAAIPAFTATFSILGAWLYLLYRLSLYLIALSKA